MLRRGDELIGKRIHAIDGELGHLREFYFDDLTWTIRHLVVDTGTWLSGRSVLISPVAVQSDQDFSHSPPVNLTRDQVRTSPWPGKKVLLSTGWVDAISWEEKELRVDLSKERIRQAPEYDTSRLMDRDYEDRLHEFYGQSKYWL